MKLLSKISLIVLLLVFALAAMSQEVLKGIAKEDMNAVSGYIYNEQNQLDGYYNFYLKEKLDKNNFQVSFYLYDTNLDVYAIHTIEMKSTSYILEMAKSGDLIGFVYGNSNSKNELNLFVWNFKTGENVADKSYPAEINGHPDHKYSWMSRYNSKAKDLNYFVNALAGGKFLIRNISSNGSGLKIYDVNAKKIFDAIPEEKYHYFELLYSNNDYAYVKADYDKRGINMYTSNKIEVVDLKKNKRVKTITHTDFTKPVIFKGIHHLKKDNEELVITALYNDDVNISKIYHKPASGVAIISIDPMGKVHKEKFIPWTEVNKSGSNITTKGKINGSRLYVHEFIADTAGNIIMTAESLRFKVRNAKFIPLINFAVPMYKIKTDDIYLFKYTDEFVKHERINLPKNRFTMVNLSGNDNRNYYAQLYSYSGFNKYSNVVLDSSRNTVHVRYFNNNSYKAFYIDSYVQLYAHPIDIYSTAIDDKNNIITNKITLDFKPFRENWRSAPGKVLLKKEINKQPRLLIENL